MWVCIYSVFGSNSKKSDTAVISLALSSPPPRAESTQNCLSLSLTHTHTHTPHTHTHTHKHALTHKQARTHSLYTHSGRKNPLRNSCFHFYCAAHWLTDDRTHTVCQGLLRTQRSIHTPSSKQGTFH